MEQEEKQLLLKDLCARLPYGVMCVFSEPPYGETTDIDPVFSYNNLVTKKQGGIDNCPLEYSTNTVMTDSKKSQRMISAEAKEAMYSKPAWSEEDAFRTSALTDVVKSGGSIRPELRNEFVDWLKSLKNRVIPQPKSTWSEDDELVMKDTEEAVTNYWYGQSQEDLLDWLKSLKERIGG